MGSAPWKNSFDNFRLIFGTGVWYHSLTMKLHKFLLTPPIVAISAALFCGALFGATVTFTGGADGKGTAWRTDANWDTGSQPGAGDDVVIDGKSVTVSGAVAVNSLTVTGSKAMLTVKALPLENTSVFSSRETAIAALWEHATRVTVAEAFAVKNGASVVPVCDPVTGTSVLFFVGSFELEEGAKMDAYKQGWTWTEYTNVEQVPQYADKETANGGKKSYYTFAFGHGAGYNGTSYHGGTSASSYGNAYAPFLSGSQAGAYSGISIAGGAVCVFASGAATVNGTIDVTSAHAGNGGPSGGSIWLTSGEVLALGEAALLKANGANGMNGNQGRGEGGRVCLVDGATDDTIASLLDGIVPDGFTAVKFDDDRVNVKGGVNDAKKAAAGTSWRISSTDVSTTVTVQSSPVAVIADGVTYGEVSAEYGKTISFTAGAYGIDPTASKKDVRYACKGYVISNVTEEVLRKAELTAAVTPVKGMGPYTLTWLWDDREVLATVTIDGAGEVSVGGETYDASFTRFCRAGEPVVFTASTEAADTRFISWTGLVLPGSFASTAEIAVTFEQPSALTASFLTGELRRAYVGKAGGSWHDPLNWQPGGVPGEDEDVVLEDMSIKAPNGITVKSLTVNGGSLTLGSTTLADAQVMTIAGDMTVTNGATLTVQAHELADLSVFTDKATAAAALWANRSVVKVGGRFSVSGGAKVCPVNDPVTGVPVVFEVGSFDLAADGTIDANGAGWRWQPVGSRTFPDGITKYTGAAKINNTQYASVFTLAFAPGSSYSIGASHGGLGAPRGNSSVRPPYGYRSAPFLPGSPGGTHDKTVSVSNGGGTICVLSAGEARLGGILSANAVQNPFTGDNSYSGASGGGVWIVAGQIVQTDTLTVMAKGSTHSSTLAYKPGAGGRVSFLSGVDSMSETFAELVAGGEPESLSYTDLAFSGLSVAGARNADTTDNIAADGTATQVFDASTFETLTVCGAPLDAISAGVTYGDAQLLPGPVLYAVTDYGHDPADPANVRYSCGGWVVSNATALVAEDVTATAAFDIVKGEGPYTLTWRWADRETRTVVTPAPALGTITCGGEAILEETIYWIRDGETLTLDAVPEDGCTLTTWRGVPRGGETAAWQVLSGAEPHVVTAFFHDSASATTRYWKKGADGDFYVAANWEGDVVPGFGDTVVVSNGTCRVMDRLQLAGLVVTNGATVRISNADVVTVAGDLALYGSAKLYVTARPLDAAHTFATGTTRVTVGGTLSLAGTSTLYPESDAWSGSTVRFDVGDFELAAGASVNADNLGWGWLTYTGTPAEGATTCTSEGVKYQTIAIGRGWDYGNGGSYGTKANGYSGPAYGWTNSVIHAGSPNGVYSSGAYRFDRGGGLIRIHATGLATIDGVLSADGNSGNVYGGPSGGGIWLTAKEFSFGDAAVLRARGGTANYSSNGSGGRIAIGVCTDERRIDELAETGTYPGLRKGRIHDEAFFRENVGNASMTIDVHSRPNASQVDKPGTFVYLDAARTGLMLLVK